MREEPVDLISTLSVQDIIDIIDDKNLTDDFMLDVKRYADLNLQVPDECYGIVIATKPQFEEFCDKVSLLFFSDVNVGKYNKVAPKNWFQIRSKFLKGLTKRFPEHKEVVKQYWFEAYAEALEKTKRELTFVKDKTERKRLWDRADFFTSKIQMLEDGNLEHCLNLDI